jgi:hypothetical protein
MWREEDGERSSGKCSGAVEGEHGLERGEEGRTWAAGSGVDVENGILIK